MGFNSMFKGLKNYKKTKVLPVLTEATGTISKSLRQYLSNITGKH
jgi:hypothetical protein